MLRRGLLVLVSMSVVVGAGCDDDDDGKRDAAGGHDGGTLDAQAGPDADARTPMDGGSADQLDGHALDAPDASADGAAMIDGPLDVPYSDDAAARLDSSEVDGGVDGGTIPVCGPFADGGAPPDGGPPSPTMSFFVTSQTNPTGNLGGLAGADQRCQNLAAAAGVPSLYWRAYLSVEHEPPSTGAPVNARDRIGTGPWYNAVGVLVAANVIELHTRSGDPSVFVDEHGTMINGQWTGSPMPIEHDILTGTNRDGTVAWGKTCNDWTSSAAAPDGGAPDGGGGYVARVGHSDGIGPNCSMATSPIDYTSWNSSHDNAGCDDTAPRGGAGRIYCFRSQ